MLPILCLTLGLLCHLLAELSERRGARKAQAAADWRDPKQHTVAAAGERRAP